MLKYAFISDKGGRSINEDAIKVATANGNLCFVVCDGLGGHMLGDVASKTVVNSFSDQLFFAEDLSGFLKHAFRNAQQQVTEQQKQRNAQGEMKTTAVVLATDGVTAYVGHVGDSRFYAFRRDGSYVRTLDHSVAQALVESQRISEAEIRNHPSRSMLMKVIGEKYDETLCQLQDPFPLTSFDAYLLCTDGFWELIREEEMAAQLATSATPQQWLDRMVQIVKQNGAAHKMDNYSAIVIFSANMG